MNDEKEVKEFRLDVPMKTISDSDEGKAGYQLGMSDHTEIGANYGSDRTDNRHAVALVGDRFYKGDFLAASELEKVYKMWESTLHDINHQGTTDIKGFTASSNILYFIGYNKNVEYNDKTKSVSMDIVPVASTQYASAWKGYVELCEKAGNVPNVSVAFGAKVKYVKAKELPEGVDYSLAGYKDDDSIPYIYDIEPKALSTVFRGACNDKSGCGIGMTSDDVTDEEERLALIKWIKEHEND